MVSPPISVPADGHAVTGVVLHPAVPQLSTEVEHGHWRVPQLLVPALICRARKGKKEIFFPLIHFFEKPSKQDAMKSWNNNMHGHLKKYCSCDNYLCCETIYTVVNKNEFGD